MKKEGEMGMSQSYTTCIFSGPISSAAYFM